MSIPAQVALFFPNYEYRKGLAKLSREKQAIDQKLRQHKKILSRNVRILTDNQRDVIMLMRNIALETPLSHSSETRTNASSGSIMSRSSAKRISSLVSNAEDVESTFKEDDMSSLREYQTKKIIESMKVDFEELTPSTFQIINDDINGSPFLMHILSNSNLVDILCELKTISYILENPNKFSEFQRKLSEMSSLDGSASPLKFLASYRSKAMNTFFASIAEIGNRILKRMSLRASAVNCTLLKSLAIPESQFELPYAPFTPRYSLSGEQWIKLLMLELDRIQELVQRTQAVKADRLTSVKRILFADTDELLELGTAHSNRSVKKNESKSQSTPKHVNFRDQHSWEPYLKEWTAKNSILRPPSSAITSEHCKGKAESREELTGFIQNLINEIETVEQMNSDVYAKSQKHWCTYKRIANDMHPFLKILRRPSLFAHLTDDDYIFNELEDGKVGAKRLIASQLKQTTMGRPTTGETEVTRSSHNSVHSADFNDVNNAVLVSNVDKPKSRSPPKEDSSRKAVQRGSRNVTVQRVTCIACRAKMRRAKEEMLSRCNADKDKRWTRSEEEKQKRNAKQFTSLAQSYNTDYKSSLTDIRSQVSLNQNQSDTISPLLVFKAKTLRSKKTNTPKDLLHNSTMKSSSEPKIKDKHDIRQTKEWKRVTSTLLSKYNLTIGGPRQILP